MDSPNLSGFDPRVQDQLAQISNSQRGRRSSQSSASSSQASHYSQYSQYSQHNQYNTQIHPRSSRYPRNQYGYMPRQPAQAPPGIDAFPPLGSEPPANVHNMPQHSYQSPQGSGLVQNNYQTPSAAQEFFSRARGRGRGRSNRQSNNRVTQMPANDYVRPAAQNQRLYMPNQNPHFVTPDQQRADRQRLMEQADYLNHLVTKSAENMLSTEEIGQKQQFSQRLESIARQLVLADVTLGGGVRRPQIKLQPYGSLANSFGTTGCDVDLLLTVQEQNSSYIEISEDIKRGLEKALLNQGIGARLLVNTRVPILRVCEKPSAELLKALRDHRAKWELSLLETEISQDQRPRGDFGPLPHLTESQEAKQLAAMADLSLNAAEIALPPSPLPDPAKLEYSGDCGIQCDINFTNRIALHNSRLLWTYGQCDPKVRNIGIFVKNWAKARDINTPYRGTLSSYGYILMVLHYLINVANPPILPNLQELAKDHGWSQTPPELFEGHDIRFTHDLKAIRREMASKPRNNTSIGALLVGFFRYYGTLGGFRWVEHVISIRSPGGILTKEHKGWTKARWSEGNSNVRQRYLLALEDPFEIDHNVGRTVGHNGLVAIREEFRRACDIIDSIQRTPSPQGQSWTWNVRGQDESGDGFDLIRPSEGRGDTLRKDANARKARQMREKIEQQHSLATQNNQQGEEEAVVDEVGMLTARENHLEVLTSAVDNPAPLIHDIQHQDEKVSKMRGRKPERQRHHEEDAEQDTLSTNEAQSPREADTKWNLAGLEKDDSNSDSIGVQGQARGPQQSQNVAGEPAAPQTKAGEISEVSTDVSRTKEQSGEATGIWSSSARMQTAERGGKLEAASEITQETTDGVTNIMLPGSPKSEAAESSLSPPYGQTANQICDSESVGENIAWTTKSKAGLWLLNRDKKIREGTFKPPTASDLGRLNAMFPYKSMSKEELAQMNQRLEEWYRDSYYRKRAVSLTNQSLESNKVFVEVTTDVKDEDRQPQEQAKDTVQHVSSTNQWPAGADILWSTNTDAGRWLRWRDRRVKEGTWKDDPEDKGLSQELSRLFPHNSENTLANIERMNTELDIFFTGLLYPRPTMRYQVKKDVYAKMARAMDNLVAHRRLQNRDTPTPPSAITRSSIEAPQIHSSSRSEQIIENGRCAVSESPEDTLAPSVSWQLTNHTGAWLQWRDDMIQKGSWRPDLAENSVFGHIDKLYPFDPNPSPEDREKQNQEISTFFQDVMLPLRGCDRAEPAYKAILNVFQHRKDHTETKRVQLLLNIFREHTMEGLQEVRDNSMGRPDAKERHENDERSLQAVKALSGQLGSEPSSSINHDFAEYVRKQRLAFFERQRAQSASSNAAPDMLPVRNAEISVRRDSAAEGSWNGPVSSPQNLNPCAVPFVLDTNTTKPTGRTNPQSPPPTPRSNDEDPFEPKRQHDPATTDESAGELIPKTLHPKTWRTNRKHRHEDPRIIPIPRKLDFPFDTCQLADIDSIRCGGNGCVRGGQSPYMLESDRHSWGGGGAMAQQSESLQWSWSMHGHTHSDSGVGMEEDFMKRVELLDELPASADLLTE